MTASDVSTLITYLLLIGRVLAFPFSIRIRQGDKVKKRKVAIPEADPAELKTSKNKKKPKVARD